MPQIARTGRFQWLLLLAATLNWHSIAAQTWSAGELFRQKMKQPIGATWADTPLRDALDSLAASHGVFIFLDRRVDPTMPVTFSTDLMPFAEMLKATLKPLGLGVGFVGPVVYVGPRHTAARVATLAELRNEKARQQDKQLRQRLLKKQSSGWDELSQPRAIISQLLSDAGLEFEHRELIPHDLWRAADLPPLTIPERLTLVLAGFNMNFTILDHEQGPRFRLTRFPVGVAIERAYPGGASPQQRMAIIEKKYPQATAELQDNRLLVRTLLEDHWELAAELEGNKKNKQDTPPRGPAQRAYTLQVQNKPAGKVLEILAGQLGMTVEFDAETTDRQQQLVTFSVDKASPTELLEAAAAPAQLSVTIEGTVVLITKQ